MFHLRAVGVLFLALNIGGCVDEEPIDESTDTSTDDASDDPGTYGDAETTSASDAELDSVESADGEFGRDIGSDSIGDADNTCNMGATSSDDGCPCETHRLQCCWAGLHIECVAPPGQSYSYWGEVHDADWNCDEYPDCEDFEGVPAP